MVPSTRCCALETGSKVKGQGTEVWDKMAGLAPLKTPTRGTPTQLFFKRETSLLTPGQEATKDHLSRQLRLEQTPLKVQRITP